MQGLKSIAINVMCSLMNRDESSIILISGEMIHVYTCRNDDGCCNAPDARDGWSYEGGKHACA